MTRTTEESLTVFTPDLKVFVLWNINTKRICLRSTTKIRFNLSQQQRDWLTRQYNYGLPVYAVLAIDNQVLVTQDFEKHNFSVQEFEEKSVHVKEFVHIISNICLNKGT